MRKKSRQKDEEESGNQRLDLIVLVLTAVFLALGIYAITYSRKPLAVNRRSENAKPSALAVSEITTDTTVGVRSFSGVIREINNGRLTVSLSEIRNAKRVDRLILVTASNDVPVYSLGAVTMEATASGAPRAVREKTPADRSTLSVGMAVEIQSPDVVDNKTAVVAAEINILSP